MNSYLDPSMLSFEEGCIQDSKIRQLLESLTPLPKSLLFAREKVLFWVFQVNISFQFWQINKLFLDSKICEALEVSVRSVEVFVFVFDTYWSKFQSQIQRQDIQVLAVSTLGFVLQEIDQVYLPLETMRLLCKSNQPEDRFIEQMENLKQNYGTISEIISPSILLQHIDKDFDMEDFKVAVIFFFQMNDEGIVKHAVDILYITLRFIRTSHLMLQIDHNHIDSLINKIIPFLKTSESELNKIVNSINDFVSIHDTMAEETCIQTESQFHTTFDKTFEFDSPILPKQFALLSTKTSIFLHPNFEEDEEQFSSSLNQKSGDINYTSHGIQSGVFQSSPALNEFDSRSNFKSQSETTTNQQTFSYQNTAQLDFNNTSDMITSTSLKSELELGSQNYLSTKNNPNCFKLNKFIMSQQTNKIRSLSSHELEPIQQFPINNPLGEEVI